MDDLLEEELLEDFTPEAIAEALFNQEPKDALTCRIVTESEGMDATYIFELLITILLEGMEIIIGDLSKADLSNLTDMHISGLNPWFHSLGFFITVDTFDKNEEDDEEEYDEYYCKVMIKSKLNEVIFEHKNIDKNYHFLINGQYLKENKSKTNVKDLYGIFINNDTVFKINFQFYIPVVIANNTKLL